MNIISTLFIGLTVSILIDVASKNQEEGQISTADGPRYVVKSDGVIYDEGS